MENPMIFSEFKSGHCGPGRPACEPPSGLRTDRQL